MLKGVMGHVEALLAADADLAEAIDRIAAARLRLAAADKKYRAYVKRVG